MPVMRFAKGKDMRRLITILTTATVAGCAIAACATDQAKPTEQLTKATTLVEQADKAQAQRYAAEDLQRARSELSSAESASNAGHYDAARAYAESAAVDADVATAKASDGEAQHAARDAVQGNATLEHEAQRAADSGASSSAPPPPESDPQAPPPPPPPRPAPPPTSPQ